MVTKYAYSATYMYITTHGSNNAWNSGVNRRMHEQLEIVMGTLGTLETVRTLVTLRRHETVETLQTVGMLETIGMLGTAETLERLGTLGAVHQKRW